MIEQSPNDPPPAAPDASPPAVEPPPAVAAEPPHPVRVPAQPSRTARPVLTALGFVLLLAGLGWVWYGQQQLSMQVDSWAQRPVAAPAAPGVDPARVAAIEGKLRDLESRLSALQQRATPGAPPPPAPAPQVSLAPLESRLAALEARGPADTGAADERIAGIDARLKAVEQQQAALAERALRVLGFERAQLALEVGEPLGDLPGAPPALARFAHAKPPTEAALRLAFPAAADAAEAASHPSSQGLPLGERMWTRIRALVLVKQGDHVLLGPPAAAVLGNAHAKLEAGDLPGAVASLDGLDAAAAAAMANWRAAAQALLDARAALAAAAAS